MKYYSEILDKKFDTENELNEAEAEYKQKTQEQEVRYACIKEMIYKRYDLDKQIEEAISDYIKDYDKFKLPGDLNDALKFMYSFNF